MKKVRNLQKLMLRSRSNTLTSVKRVTQQSGGRKTAGVDGETALTPAKRWELANCIQDDKTWGAKPVKRVYIPKSNGKQRPLGIPVMRDRVNQARVKNALEPEWEARFERRSYGFRPGRGCHDAVEGIYSTTSRKGASRLWVLDADLAAAFDRIDHDYLLEAVGYFPAREMIRGWLKAGVMDRGRYAPMVEGTPQGGVISPLLLNVALHGMEDAAGCRYKKGNKKEDYQTFLAVPGTPVLIRYADDLVALCDSEEQAVEVKDRLAKWLEPRGLRFNEEKTWVVHMVDGFDFLGFTFRRKKDKTIVTPSGEATKKIRERMRVEVKSLHGANIEALIRKLNPIVRGWGTYYRIAVSSKEFRDLDDYMWRLTRKWAKRMHPLKSEKWVYARYYGRFNTKRKDNWVMGDKKSGAYLLKFRWTKIVRHVQVRGEASPDNPELTEYWIKRRGKKTPPPMDQASLYLAWKQKGICPLCFQALIGEAEYEPDNPREWIEWFAATKRTLNKHHFVYRRDGGSDHKSNLRLVHAECHRQHHAKDGTRNSTQEPARPEGLA
jgi:RNA-directed DNA polymerase